MMESVFRWPRFHMLASLTVAASLGSSAVLCSPSPAGAQALAATRIGASPAVVTVASAILPGAGQAIMHQKRSVLYLALEAAGVGFYISQNRDGSRQRDVYREISRSVARAQFSPNGPQGNWDYYERMEKFVASGVFDAIEGGDVNPETDATTYNGSVWQLARQTYWRDPDVVPAVTSEEYQSAIKFYGARAVRSEFRWSWLGAPEPFQKYRAAIASSNSAFRNAEQTASLILANHFLSAIDAYVSIHARVTKHSDGSTRVTAAVPLHAF